MTADRHELLCAYDDCEDGLRHLRSDVSDATPRIRGVLENYGINGYVDRDDIEQLRRAHRRLSESAAR